MCSCFKSCLSHSTNTLPNTHSHSPTLTCTLIDTHLTPTPTPTPTHIWMFFKLGRTILHLHFLSSSYQVIIAHVFCAGPNVWFCHLSQWYRRSCLPRKWESARPRTSTDLWIFCHQKLNAPGSYHSRLWSRPLKNKKRSHKRCYRARK